MKNYLIKYFLKYLHESNYIIKKINKTITIKQKIINKKMSKNQSRGLKLRQTHYILGKDDPNYLSEYNEEYIP